MKKDIPKYLTLTIWLILGLYFGTGGITKMENYNLIKSTIGQSDTIKVIYRGVPFQNKSALLRKLEEDQMISVFPWLDKLPSFASYIITACAFGLLGAVIRIFIQIVIEHKKIDEIHFYTAPILGLLSGLITLGASLIFPAVLYSNDKEIKAGGLMFVCLFSGLFFKEFYRKLYKLFTKAD